MAADPGLGATTDSASKMAPSAEVPPTGGCPFLLAEGGGWRADRPAREHRCTAISPPTPLDSGKQRRLCLEPAHATCATYRSALAARDERGTPSDRSPHLRWEVVRTTPVVEVRLGFRAAMSGIVAERRGWQAIPALLLVLLVAAAGLSGLGRSQPAAGPAAPTSAVAVATASPSPRAATEPAPTISSTVRPSPAPTATPTPTLAATPTPGPTPRPVATPAPSARTTYTVKAGDSLYGIAGTFGTSVAAIKQLNGLTSNTIRVGLVLLIP